VGGGFVRPATEDVLTELAEFLDHALLGRVSIGTIGDGLIERVDEVMETGAQLGAVRQALFERALGFGNAGGQ
jgi:thiamine monophosphate synthase